MIFGLIPVVIDRVLFEFSRVSKLSHITVDQLSTLLMYLLFCQHMFIYMLLCLYTFYYYAFATLLLFVVVGYTHAVA